MLRTAAIALGVSLVAFVATGMRSDPAPAVQGEVGLVVQPAPIEGGEPEGSVEDHVTFSLPENQLPGPAWSAPQIALDAAPEAMGPAGLLDLFPYIEDEAAAGEGMQAPSPMAFPKREDWETFSRRLDFALAAGSLERLVALEPEARAMLQALQAIPGDVEYAGWLKLRLDEIEVVRRAAEIDQSAAVEDEAGVPYYHAWLEWMRHRPPPKRAAEYVQRLKPFFIAANVPPALVWIAETESGFNPNARNRVGARGLYQIMPATARELGMRLRPHDERLNPLLNAQSAARYLAYLQSLYADWPLALAAYNAGPTRVSRLLKLHRASSFAEIASFLPTETQLYVPRVLATLAVREGVTPTALALTQAALATR